MQLIPTSIPDVKLIEPKVFKDERGYFFESYQDEFIKVNFPELKSFVQENESKSTKGVLRGLHYQLPPFAQSKLVRVIQGSVIDVAVDIRRNSPSFGKHVAFELSEKNFKQLFIPQGFAHGFLVLSETAVFSYKVDALYAPKYERGIIWNDPEIGINWGLSRSEISLSKKDLELPTLKDNKELFMEALCTS
jgi:dTDP-4-dehydrorhamnose 3,5-epimerase